MPRSFHSFGGFGIDCFAAEKQFFFLWHISTVVFSPQIL